MVNRAAQYLLLVSQRICQGQQWLPSPRANWRRQPGQPGETGGSNRLEHCLLVLAAVGLLAGAPGPPYLVAEPVWHLVPVAAAHQASLVDLITAARYWAETYR
jgi:hypothetical protein